MGVGLLRTSTSGRKLWFGTEFYFWGAAWWRDFYKVRTATFGRKFWT